MPTLKDMMKVLLAIAEVILAGILIGEIVKLAQDDPEKSLIKAVFMATAFVIILIPLIKGKGNP